MFWLLKLYAMWTLNFHSKNTFHKTIGKCIIKFFFRQNILTSKVFSAEGYSNSIATLSSIAILNVWTDKFLQIVLFLLKILQIIFLCYSQHRIFILVVFLRNFFLQKLHLHHISKYNKSCFISNWHSPKNQISSCVDY